MKFSDIKIGLGKEIKIAIGERDMDFFFRITGDRNIIHRGDDGIVYGMLTASFISTLIGNHLPGDGATWKSQTLKFVAPVKVGDTISIKGEVIAKDTDRKEITLYTDIYNQRDEVVLFGTSVIKCTI